MPVGGWYTLVAPSLPSALDMEEAQLLFRISFHEGHLTLSADNDIIVILGRHSHCILTFMLYCFVAILHKTTQRVV